MSLFEQLEEMYMEDGDIWGQRDLEEQEFLSQLTLNGSPLIGPPPVSTFETDMIPMPRRTPTVSIGVLDFN